MSSRRPISVEEYQYLPDPFDGRAAADLQGRNPARQILALAAHPMQEAAQAGRRNLGLLAARGLVHEVMGQGRFRVWAAKL